MRNNEVSLQVQSQKHIQKVLSTLCFTFSCFLLGIALHKLLIIVTLKVSLIVLIAFTFAFLCKQPCALQYFSLILMAFGQGVMFSALFLKQHNTTLPIFLQGFLTTIGILVSAFGVIINSDKDFKRKLSTFAVSASWVLFWLILFLKILCFTKHVEQKIILLIMTGHLLYDMQKITIQSLRRNFILDALLISVDILQIFIRTLLILGQNRTFN